MEVNETLEQWMWQGINKQRQDVLAMDAAADEGLHGRNVLSLFINALLRPLLQSFVDFHVPFAVLVVLGALEIFFNLLPVCCTFI